MNTCDTPKKHLALTMIGRGLLAAGGVFLIVKKIKDAKESRNNWPMIAVGAASAIPLAMGVVQNIKEAKHAMMDTTA